MMQSLSGLEELESMLLGIFFGIMGTILLFFLLVLLNIAVMKMIIWLLTTGKKIDYKVILKSLLLTFIMFCIFFIPLILSLFPLISLSEEYMRTQVLKGGIMYFIPFIIIFFITIYFTSLASYFLAKESSLRKALKNCFVIGIKKISQLILPFLGLFIITFAIGNILRNMGLLALWPGLLAVVLVIVIISFFNRIYISRAI
ncbi:MAG: hypothetical protein KAK00_09410 [Nanoarchaeota archaeon]|nr:hypothetical protein [Nanoarchaeota archaeon]